jgi:hypothetical protein
MIMETLIKTLKAARRCGTPLVAIATPDQPAAIATLAEGALNGDTPLVRWDACRGIRPLNDKGVDALTATNLDAQTLELQGSQPVEAVKMLAKLPARAVCFYMQAPRYLAEPFLVQGIMNLRDIFKTDERMLILLGSSFDLPTELQSDVVVLEDPYPDDEQLTGIAGSLLEYAKVEAKDGEIEAAVDAVRGLSAYGAEQVVAMSISKDGIDVDSCWARKIAAVNQTAGLTLQLSTKSDKIGGLEAISDYGDRLFNGEEPPRAVLFIDEIEKALAGIGGQGAAGDSSGVSQDALGVLLRWMDGGGSSSRNPGLLTVGPPGTGKSLFSQNLASRHARPMFTLDLGDLKGSLVGESEAKIREAFKVIDSVAAGATLVVATCNDLDILPAALRRRFAFGTWFCDLPTAAERNDIWTIHREGFGLDPEEELPLDDQWTGADIRNCCDVAKRLIVPLVEAAKYIVPVSKSDAEGVERLRRSAEGRWLSASTVGTYRREGATDAAGARRFGG